MDIVQLNNIFEEIEWEMSKNRKEEIIKRNAEVDGFKELLQFVYNPFIVTGLAKKKISKKIALTSSMQVHDLKQALEFVKENNTGSDSTITVIRTYIDSLENENLKTFATNVLTKDLKVGITLKTVNKALGKDFIPDYGVMLASKWEDHEHKINETFQVSLKLDGTRCTVLNEANGPKFFTRQGHPIEGLVELEEIFEQLPKGIVYDGELIALNPTNMSSDDLFRHTQKLVRKDGIKRGIQFWAFDRLPIEEFKKGESEQILSERVIKLKKDLKEFTLNNLIHMVPIYYTGEDKTVIPEILADVTSQGLEGLMVSPLNSYYTTKRSRQLLKVKKFQTADLIIIGYEEHKHGDKLGSLIVDYKKYSVNVGSGYSDQERKELWEKREEILGKIVEVGFFEESKNQNGGISLRFPTFKTMRPDKDSPSYN